MGTMRRPLRLTLSLALLLTACRPAAPEDLPHRVLSVANGSYDAQADARTRQGGGIRQVRWERRPPLEARLVTVDYDSDLRPQGWVMDVRGARFGAGELEAGGDGQAVTTPSGAGLRLRAGPLRDVLVLSPRDEPGHLRLLTRGYVAQHEPALLGAFGAGEPGRP